MYSPGGSDINNFDAWENLDAGTCELTSSSEFLTQLRYVTEPTNILQAMPTDCSEDNNDDRKSIAEEIESIDSHITRLTRPDVYTNPEPSTSTSTCIIIDHSYSMTKAGTLFDSDEELDVCAVDQTPNTHTLTNPEPPSIQTHQREVSATRKSKTKPKGNSRKTPRNRQRRKNSNALERLRRLELKNLFENVKRQIPQLCGRPSASRATILKEAASYCRNLRKKELELLKEKKEEQERQANLNQRYESGKLAEWEDLIKPKAK